MGGKGKGNVGKHNKVVVLDVFGCDVSRRSIGRGIRYSGWRQNR